MLYSVVIVRFTRKRGKSMVKCAYANGVNREGVRNFTSNVSTLLLSDLVPLVGNVQSTSYELSTSFIVSSYGLDKRKEKIEFYPHEKDYVVVYAQSASKSRR